jgi:hypothetical protein
MDVDELIERAWKTVEKAGVSEAAQPAALQEAVAFLREQDGSSGGGNTDGEGSSRRKQGSGGTRRSKSRQPAEPHEDSPDEDTFFATLASESGVEESELRDVSALQGREGHRLAPDPDVRRFEDCPGEGHHGARRRSPREGPRRVDRPGRARTRRAQAKAVLDRNNFNKHLRALQGYNVGSDRLDIVTNWKWVGEFSDAVAHALDKAADE